MKDDLQAATERLRQLYAGNSPYTAERDADYMEALGMTQCERDEEICARAWVKSQEGGA